MIGLPDTFKPLACRATVDLATSLASLTFARSSAKTAQPAGTSSSLLPKLGCVQAVCELAGRLVAYTVFAVRQGCQLEPAVVFRLASCANVALDPAAKAVQEAYAATTTEGLHQSSTETARKLANACNAVLCALNNVVALASVLDCQATATAVQATVCRCDKLASVYHQCGPILKWCAEKLGEAVQLTEALGSSAILYVWVKLRLRNCHAYLQIESCSNQRGAYFRYG